MADMQPADMASQESDKLISVLNFLEKHNLSETADVLRNEARKNSIVLQEREESTDMYNKAYSDLLRFIMNCDETHMFELKLILYPVFAHMYLNLVFKGCFVEALTFMNRYRSVQKSYYQDNVQELSLFVKPDLASKIELIDCLRNNKFVVRLSHGSHRVLKNFLQCAQETIVQEVINKYCIIDVNDYGVRTEEVIDAAAGYMLGEASSVDNGSKVFYGLLFDQSTMSENSAVSDTEQDDAENPIPRKKKAKPSAKKRKTIDPNAPPLTRMPQPPLRDVDRAKLTEARRELSHALKLSPFQLPSICCLTAIDRMYEYKVTCMTLSDDTRMMVVGTSDANIMVFSLTGKNLLEMKPTEKLLEIEIEADDVWTRIFNRQNGKGMVSLRGHFGSIYNTSLSTNNALLLSCSSDTTIRLWSLQVWTCLVVYKGHMVPVWDVQFSPHGYFFATAANDKTARLWSTDRNDPVRVFVGHFSDVSSLRFHPNGNYVATGSQDRSIRLWDCLTGQCVRLLTGHKADVISVLFSTNGLYLASGSLDKTARLWSVASGDLIFVFNAHTESVCCLSFSRDDHVLATGSNDWSVKLWDIMQLKQENEQKETAVQIFGEDNKVLLGSYATKATSILGLQFGRTNCLIAAGRFENISKMSEYYR